VARLRPAPVAVHDHRDVAREIRGGFGAQMWNGETHFACPQIMRKAQIQKATFSEIVCACRFLSAANRLDTKSIFR